MKIAAVTLAAATIAFMPERSAADPNVDANALCALIDEKAGSRCKVLEWEQAIEFYVDHGDFERAIRLCWKIAESSRTLSGWRIYVRSVPTGGELAECIIG